MRIVPRSLKEFERVALEILIGTNIALQVPNLAEAIAQPQPATLDLSSNDTTAAVYKDLPRSRYAGLVPFSDAAKGTVKFVEARLSDKFQQAKTCLDVMEQSGTPLNCPRVIPQIEFNFNYKFVVTDRSQNLFDYKSAYMQKQPGLQQEYDQVLRGFCANYKDQENAARYCELGMR